MVQDSARPGTICVLSSGKVTSVSTTRRPTRFRVEIGDLGRVEIDRLGHEPDEERARAGYWERSWWKEMADARTFG